MFDFPNAPVTGDVFTPSGSGVSWQWDGEKWRGGAPSTTQTEQFFDLSGKTAQNVTVPSWAKGVEITMSHIPTASQSVCVRVSVDGTTFLAGASNYVVIVPYHNQSPTGTWVATTPTQAQSFWTICGAGSQTVTPSQTEAFFLLERKLTNEGFTFRAHSQSFDATNGLVSAWWAGWVDGAAPGSALRIQALQFLQQSGGAFGNGSYLKVRWVGDLAALPQGNAIVDAPADARLYQRKSGAWESMSDLPWCEATRGTNADTLPVGNLGLVGTITSNQGGWAGDGIAVGGSGSSLVVPRTGLYWIKNRVYVQPSRGLGRLDVTVNSNGIGLFCQPNTSTPDIVYEYTGFYRLTAGDKIAYNISQTALGAYCAANHTGIHLRMVGG